MKNIPKIPQKIVSTPSASDTQIFPTGYKKLLYKSTDIKLPHSIELKKFILHNFDSCRLLILNI